MTPMLYACLNLEVTLVRVPDDRSRLIKGTSHGKGGDGDGTVQVRVLAVDKKAQLAFTGRFTDASHTLETFL